MGYGHGHVLFLATGVGKAEVNKLDFVVFHHFHDVCDGLGHQILLCGCGLKNLYKVECSFCAKASLPGHSAARLILP
jgi:hypothetical protein